MKEYDSIENIKYDRSLVGEEVWIFNKLDGQNLRVKYSPKQKEFVGFGSRHMIVDENSEVLGDAVAYFKNSDIPNVMKKLIKENSGKGGIFNGVEEITFFFEWYGDNSFAGFHVHDDNMHLALIDAFTKKRGYIEPKPYYEIFCNRDDLETPELIYKGKLTEDVIKSIQENDWTQEGCKYPNVKEGGVIRRSTMLKGQRLPKAKVKTIWWITELHKNYTEDECKLLE